MGVSIASTVCNIDMAKIKKQLQTNDKIIRAALTEKLYQKHANDKTVRIIQELGVNHGTSRIDIAVVNGVLHGYEIKSDLDTFDRLPEQMSTYNKIFNKMTIVVGWSHLEAAINTVPDWWGITVAKQSEDGTIMLHSIRDCEYNREQDNIYIAKLLWRDEAIQTLEAIGKAKGVRSKPRSIVYERLVEALGSNELQKKVRETLFFRPDWRVDQQLLTNGG